MDPNVIKLAMGAAGAGSANNKLYGWGNNPSFSLADGGANRSSPIQIGALTDWSQISNNVHAASIKNDGTLWVWGRNGDGQLGLGDITTRSVPVQVGSLNNWLQVKTINLGTVAIKTDGTLWSWGRNNLGQLGLGNTTDYSSPKQVGSLTNWAKLAENIHDRSVAAIKTDGTLWTWGYNSFGQLGLGDTTNRSSPTQVGSLTNWSSVASGESHILAIKTDGTLWAIGGLNRYGQLGDNTITDRSSPVQIGSLTNWSKVRAAKEISFSIKTNGTLWAWGWNLYGQLGLGTSGFSTEKSSPTQVGSLTNWSVLGGGRAHTLSIKTDKTLWAWGLNNNGQLGDGTTTYRSSPVQVGTSTNWIKLGDGGVSNTSFAITE